ncbi:MAG: pyridoxamine 5'-phosphate oxidase family protein [Leptolyngbya sp. BL-A-14]
MAKVFDSITDDLQRFIAAQQLFFVATAPLAADGHVNLSPKGLDSFRILSPNQVAYLDVTGSGNETSAHLQENGRITFMFCAFREPPLILRLYGKGQTILPEAPEWKELSSRFSRLAGTRQIIVATIDRVQTSCGMGVPLYEAIGQRDSLLKWAEKKGEEGLHDYQQQKNSVSIDGLPAPLAGQYLSTCNQIAAINDK